MNTLTFLESEMQFGPFQPEDCFRIDKSQIFAACGDGMKMADFVLVQTPQATAPRVWMVEAKKSFPKQESKEDFKNRMDEIRDKLANGLQLTIAACLNRHPAGAAELPVSLKDLDLGNADFRFALIIKTHEKHWLGDVQNILRKNLKIFCRTWGLSANAVVVLNETKAAQCGLIMSQ